MGVFFFYKNRIVTAVTYIYRASNRRTFQTVIIDRIYNITLIDISCNLFVSQEVTRHLT